MIFKLILCFIIAISLTILHIWVDTKIKKKGDVDDD